MSEDRTYVILAQPRQLQVDEDREWGILLERRVLDIQDEERALEVFNP